MFDPRTIVANPVAPPVVLTALKIFNRPLGVGTSDSPLSRPISDTRELTVSYRQSVLTFEFAALNYLVPAKNQYRYRLEGFEREWNAAGPRHSATYTNLSPGRYVLRVQASNNDGVWNREGAALVLRVAPPFWRRDWFLALVAVVVAAMLALAYRWRVASLDARRRELARHYDAIVAERSRLARELHDTLGQWLAAMKLQLGVVASWLRSSPRQAEENLELASRMLGRCIDEARRSVMDLRAQALEDSDLPTALAQQAAMMTVGSAPRVTVRVSGRPRRLDAVVEHHLLRIGQEALTNAVKHSGGDRIGIELRYAEAFTSLIVVDNGHGLSSTPGVSRGHFGLLGIRERVAKLRGSISLSSRLGGGLEVRVSIPRASEGSASTEDDDLEASHG
jgi:signal transduction histidine kinase